MLRVTLGSNEGLALYSADGGNLLGIIRNRGPRTECACELSKDVIAVRTALFRGGEAPAICPDSFIKHFSNKESAGNVN